jgi:hypothetical protein
VTPREVKDGNEDQLLAYLREVLPEIDRELVRREVSLDDRTFQAAIDFTQLCVLEVHESGTAKAAPGDVKAFIATRWFATIFYHVEQWYRDLYGEALDRKPDKYITGIVEIAGTPFALRVPTVRTRPGTPGETIWVAFPDSVHKDERALDWVVNGPNVDKLNKKDQTKASQDAWLTAGSLRYIRTSIMSIPHDDEKLVGLIAGIVSRLENAASLLLRTGGEPVQHAYWEIQLACEHALKAASQQQMSTFRETHDLFLLYDALNPKPTFKRDVLKQMPPWRETAEMRYGMGMRNSRRECLATYRAALTIVAGSLRSMKKAGIGKAQFEIRRPPWFEIADKAR